MLSDLSGRALVSEAFGRSREFSAGRHMESRLIPPYPEAAFPNPAFVFAANPSG